MHTNKIIIPQLFKIHIGQPMPNLGHLFLAALCRLKIMRRQRQTDREIARPGVQHIKGLAMRFQNDVPHTRIGHKLEQPQPVGRNAKRLRRLLPPRPIGHTER